MMLLNAEPATENEFRGEHARLLLSSFYQLTGRQLVNHEQSAIDRYRTLFEAPFCVVSHDTADDPVFNYGNKAALALFEMSWEQFTRLPSRYSAEQQDRQERERLLEKVTRDGFIDDYQGVRISSTGKRFMVEDAVVWNLLDEQGNYQGQAAVLYRWSVLK